MGKMLEGKTALITGGGSGVGRAAAILFAQEGANVMIAGRKEDKLKDTINIVKSNNKDAEINFCTADVSDEISVIKLITETVKKFGKLDTAFNCAGYDGDKMTTDEFKVDEWDRIIDINQKGTYFLMKYEVLAMLHQKSADNSIIKQIEEVITDLDTEKQKETRSALENYKDILIKHTQKATPMDDEIQDSQNKLPNNTIINMGSISGILGRPGRLAYNASRAAVISMTKTASMEYIQKGIRINAVAPAAIDTDIFKNMTGKDPAKRAAYEKAHPIGRIAQPNEIAEAALWLASPRSSFVVGHSLVIDGGLTLL